MPKMEKETTQNACNCACTAELDKLQKQLRAASRMVESGYQDTSLVAKIQNKIDKLQKKQNQCKKTK